MSHPALALLLLLLAVLAAPLPVAAAPQDVSFASAWALRDTATYEITKSKTAEGKTRSATTIVTVAVVGKTADGWLIEWRGRDFRPYADAPAAHKETLVALVKGMKIVYATDKSGAYLKIVNLAEVRAWLDAMKAQLTALIPDDELRAGTRKILDGLSVDDTLILTAGRDIALFHFPYSGRTFEDGEPYGGPVSLPNVFDPSRPFAGSLTLVAKHAGGFRQMTIRQQLDKEKSAAALKGIIEKLAAAAGITPPNELQAVDGAEITDLVQYTYAETGNWPDTISAIRTIKLAGYGREEKTEFRRLR